MSRVHKRSTSKRILSKQRSPAAGSPFIHQKQWQVPRNKRKPILIQFNPLRIQCASGELLILIMKFSYQCFCQDYNRPELWFLLRLGLEWVLTSLSYSFQSHFTHSLKNISGYPSEWAILLWKIQDALRATSILELNILTKKSVF